MGTAKCCSVIVTYNRKELLCRNISKNLEQTAKQDILVVDNASTDGTEKELRDRGYLDNQRLIYKRNEKNVFGSGGFSTGLEYVFSQGYDYAWLMDDDGYPMNENALQRLLEVADNLQMDEVMLNSMVLCNSDALSFGLAGISTLSQAKQIGRCNELNILKDTINPFNGTLISKATFEKIGNIRGNFMIHGDETEFHKRALKNNIFVASVVDSLYYHPRNPAKLFEYKGKLYPLRFTPYWMEYYEARNYIYIARKYGSRKDAKAIRQKSFAKIKNAPRDKMKYFLYISLGILAGYTNYFKPLNRNR